MTYHPFRVLKPVKYACYNHFIPWGFENNPLFYLWFALIIRAAFIGYAVF